MSLVVKFCHFTVFKRSVSGHDDQWDFKKCVQFCDILPNQSSYCQSNFVSLTNRESYVRSAPGN